MSKLLQVGSRRPEVSRGARVQIDFEGRKLDAYIGESVGAALLASGIRVLSRSIKFHRPRGLFCMTGDCASCLMRIDGQPNLRACRVPVRDGLSCERQNAWPSARLDVLAAADEMFPQGMDHHTLLTAPRPLNWAMQKVVQRLGGLGRLPDKVPNWNTLPTGQNRHVDVLVIGAGPAGLAAATAVAAASAAKRHSVLLVESAESVGGSYLCDPRYGPSAATAALTAACSAGVQIMTSAAAIGYYPEEFAVADSNKAAGMLAVAAADGIHKLSADRYIYATGGHEQNLLFLDNDRPGVLAARAVGRLHTQYGLCVGKNPLIVGNGEYADALSAALRQTGATVKQLADGQEVLHRALGRAWVNGAVLRSLDGAERTVRCDLIAVVRPPAAAFELPHMHDAALCFDEERGFLVATDEDGRTSVSSVFACGDVAASSLAHENEKIGVLRALHRGHRVGAAVAKELG